MKKHVFMSVALGTVLSVCVVAAPAEAEVQLNGFRLNGANVCAWGTNPGRPSTDNRFRTCIRPALEWFGPIIAVMAGATLGTALRSMCTIGSAFKIRLPIAAWCLRRHGHPMGPRLSIILAGWKPLPNFCKPVPTS